jgi:hypothetical protein
MTQEFLVYNPFSLFSLWFLVRVSVRGYFDRYYWVSRMLERGRERDDKE